MKNLKQIALFLGLVFAAETASAQPTHPLVMTSITSAMTATQNYAVLASATGVAAAKGLYIDNELMVVGTKYTSGLTVPVSRNTQKKSAHIANAMVLVGNQNWFNVYDPFGEPSANGTATCPNVWSSPWVNTNTGNQFLCGLLNQWVPGFGNTSYPVSATAAVASAAGLITPSGPLFHVTGALAITGFTIPVGFSKGGFCVIPDGAFTTTTANNIALASTAVVSKTICWTYDVNAAKPFFPSY